MNAETESLVLEHLCATRADVGAVRDDVRDLRHRVSSTERHLANIQSDIANIQQRHDTHGDCLGRIERGLELADAPA